MYYNKDVVKLLNGKGFCLLFSKIVADPYLIENIL